MIDNGFRFIMGKNKKNPASYRVTQADPNTLSVGDETGIIMWSCIQDQRRDADDCGGMVADNAREGTNKEGW